jgi:hypothetical protein
MLWGILKHLKKKDHNLGTINCGLEFTSFSQEQEEWVTLHATKIGRA